MLTRRRSFARVGTRPGSLIRQHGGGVTAAEGGHLARLAKELSALVKRVHGHFSFLFLQLVLD